MRYLSVFLLLWTLRANATDYDITRYGARPDGSVCTRAIQKAIDACSGAGGGHVIVPAGTFYTGTIYLKSGVVLLLEKGAVISASTDTTDYPNNSPVTVKCLDTHGPHGGPMKNRALIYAEGQQGISIAGDGTINGNGEAAVWQRGDNGSDRPKVILFISCTDVTVKGIFLRNSPFWMQEYLGCDGLHIEGIHVYNHANWNEDGLDIDSKNVTVRDCIIDSDDDGLCLKSSLRDRPCSNVSVTNCTIASNCNAIKFGTPGFGGFQQVTITNCTVGRCVVDLLRHRELKNPVITTAPASESGIAIECVDGGQTDGITIDHITIRGTLTPIFIRLGNRPNRELWDTKTYVPTLRNVVISNVSSDEHSRCTSSITGYPGTCVENVRLSHLSFDLDGGGTPSERDVASVKENDGGYPSPGMFGSTLPASVFFIRHVRGIYIEDVSIRLWKADARYPILMDDVHGAHLRDVRVAMHGQEPSVLSPGDVKSRNSEAIYLGDLAL